MKFFVLLFEATATAPDAARFQLFGHSWKTDEIHCAFAYADDYVVLVFGRFQFNNFGLNRWRKC